ncbi:carbohydrate porin, partial [Escherichia coli]|nr:carbohydrate porin [Escherichia coli]
MQQATAAFMLVLSLQSAALAAGAETPAADIPEPERWNVHGQFTNVTQWHPSFRSPYSGTNSLTPDNNTKETVDVTLYLGLRLWKGAELYANPEIDQGFGLSNTVGLAGFSSGEAYKIGN